MERAIKPSSVFLTGNLSGVHTKVRNSTVEEDDTNYYKELHGTRKDCLARLVTIPKGEGKTIDVVLTMKLAEESSTGLKETCCNPYFKPFQIVFSTCDSTKKVRTQKLDMGGKEVKGETCTAEGWTTRNELLCRELPTPEGTDGDKKRFPKSNSNGQTVPKREHQVNATQWAPSAETRLSQTRRQSID